MSGKEIFVFPIESSGKLYWIYIHRGNGYYLSKTSDDG